jgi:GT2 family glycosyltransferase
MQAEAGVQMQVTTTGAPIPDVSVIIPVHNRARLIPFTLASLRAKHHPGVVVEVIVVDDGSTDSSDVITAREFPQALLIRLPRGGAPHARNVGLEQARGRAVLFLDSDDLIEPGYFPPRLAALARHPTADGVYGPYDFFDGDGDFNADLVKPRYARYPVETHVEREAHLWRLLAGWYIPPPAVVWRASAVRRLRGYDESLRINQDVDLVFRALVAGQGIVGCAGPRGLYRDHSVSGRQGVFGGDNVKAQDVLRLRRRFIAELEVAGLLSVRAREALGRYCFDKWFELRTSVPAIAEEFYRLSRDLSPALRVPGRWPLRFLSTTIGARSAMILASAIRRVRSRIGPTS